MLGASYGGFDPLPQNFATVPNCCTRGGDHTPLDMAEQGEDAAKKAYKEALED
jgi:hypothetical protein